MKKDLRANLRRILAALSPAQIKEKSLAAANLLFQQPEWKKAEILMLFLSLPTEIDTTPLALRAWQERKRVLAPKISWDQRRLLPIQIDSLTDGMTNSPLGIREPADGVPIPVADIDLVIVPGLGFDPLGNRLGRGRGFFDRFLAHKDFRGVACALAFEEQFVDRIPAGLDPDDEPAGVERAERDRQALSFGADEALGRQERVVVVRRRGGHRVQAHLLLGPTEGQPLGAGGHQEARDALRAFAGAREQGVEIGEPTVRDPGLRTGESPRTAPPACRGTGKNPWRAGVPASRRQWPQRHARDCFPPCRRFRRTGPSGRGSVPGSIRPSPSCRSSPRDRPSPPGG